MTSLEDIFPMKYMPSSSSQKSETAHERFVPLKHSEQKHTKIPKDDNEAPRRGKETKDNKAIW